MNRIKKQIVHFIRKTVTLFALGMLGLSIQVQFSDSTFGFSGFLNKFFISNAVAQTDNTQKQTSESEVKEQYYTYQDGDTEKYIILRHDLVMERYNPKQQDSANKLPSDAVIFDDGQEFRVVKKQSWHKEGDKDLFPVFNSPSGVVMALPGDVLLVFESDISSREIDAFFVNQSINPARVSRMEYAEDIFIIKTQPGWSSLELANRLAKKQQVVISTPNWWNNEIGFYDSSAPNNH